MLVQDCSMSEHSILDSSEFCDFFHERTISLYVCVDQHGTKNSWQKVVEIISEITIPLVVTVARNFDKDLPLTISKLLIINFYV